MNTQFSELTLDEAVDALAGLSEVEFDPQLGILAPHGESPYAVRIVEWLQQHDANETREMVRQLFKVILKHLKLQLHEEEPHGNAMEGAKSIMLLVVEAAKKIDHVTDLFFHVQGSVMELREFKRLQEFYLSRISRAIDEGVLGRWIAALSKIALQPTENVHIPAFQHVFVDMDSVKKDTEYELFFLRKEDSSRFFSPRLIRNMQLVSNFGPIVHEENETDLVEHLRIWQDVAVQNASKHMVEKLRPVLDKTLKVTSGKKDNELVGALNKSIMALLLTSHPEKMIAEGSPKTCLEYFQNYLSYLQEALHSREYGRFTVYPPEEESGKACLECVQQMCRSLFQDNYSLQSITPYLHELVQEGNQRQSVEHQSEATQCQKLWSHLAADYSALQKLFKRHANDPLSKIITSLEEQELMEFDPLKMGALPQNLFKVRDIQMIRIPSPTAQEFIHTAKINAPFQGFIATLQQQGEKLLYVNLQDRTSWREHARSSVLEEFQYKTEEALTVISLPVETEFYRQLSPYDTDSQVDVFVEHILEHLKDEQSGFYFPQPIKKALFFEFISESLKTIQQVFFPEKNILNVEQRKDFLTIFYTLLILKVLDLVDPDFCAISCKDGIDAGASLGVSLHTFLQVIQGKQYSPEFEQEINTLLFGPALLTRDRLIHPERFHRFNSALRHIEQAVHESAWDLQKVKQLYRYF